MFGPTIEPDCLLLLVDLEAELRADENAVANRLQRFANQLFVDERPVAFRSVEKGDATIYGRADHGNRLLFVGGGAKAEAQTHTAKPDGRNFQITFSELARFHIFFVFLSWVSPYSPVIFSALSGSRAPCSVIFEAAASIS